jgi:hypothetical protein
MQMGKETSNVIYGHNIIKIDREDARTRVEITYAIKSKLMSM